MPVFLQSRQFSCLWMCIEEKKTWSFLQLSCCSEKITFRAVVGIVDSCRFACRGNVLWESIRVVLKGLRHRQWSLKHQARLSKGTEGHRLHCRAPSQLAIIWSSLNTEGWYHARNVAVASENGLSHEEIDTAPFPGHHHCMDLSFIQRMDNLWLTLQCPLLLSNQSESIRDLVLAGGWFRTGTRTCPDSREGRGHLPGPGPLDEAFYLWDSSASSVSSLKSCGKDRF